MSISQEDVLRCKFIGTFGTRNKFKGFSHIRESSPEIAPLEECIDANKRIRHFFGDKLRIANMFEMRVPKSDPFAQATLQQRSGDNAMLQAWVGFASGHDLGQNSLPFFCDALPPPVLIVSPSDWVPTVEYTVHFWKDPMELDIKSDPRNHTWMKSIFRSPYVQNGLLYTDGDLWSADGKQLLAKSRQLARLLSPQK